MKWNKFMKPVCTYTQRTDGSECETDMYRALIWHLIEEIKDQNLEIVSLRYLLSNYMMNHYKECTREEILSALYPFGSDQADFSYFVEHECDGENPFNTKDYNLRLMKAARGETDEEHPNIWLSRIR